ncbi:hypothetical protein F4809DRAFT_146609 [Biscogniauxia mediterranea]|nr:hypothetical protein F4809DRAFT_146609 [Biscogniauxia mediterranea]
MIMETAVEEMEVIPQPQTPQDVIDSGDDVTMGQVLGASPGTAEQGVIPDEAVPIIQSCEDGSASFDDLDGSQLHVDKTNEEVLHEEVLHEEVLHEEVLREEVPPHVEEMDEEIQLVEEDMVLQPGRQYPIEVVLSPPLDPDSYEQIPPSWTVEHILDEVETGDDIFYSVEFDDGRIDQVSHFQYLVHRHIPPHDLVCTSNKRPYYGPHTSFPSLPAAPSFHQRQYQHQHKHKHTIKHPSTLNTHPHSHQNHITIASAFSIAPFSENHHHPSPPFVSSNIIITRFFRYAPFL